MNKKHLLPVLSVTILGFLLIILELWRGDVAGWLTVFFTSWVFSGAAIILILSILFALFRKRYIACLIGLGFVVIEVILYCTQAFIWIDFYGSLSQREAFIESLDNPEVADGMISVPDQFGNISNGGNEVMIQVSSDENIDVKFYVLRGLLDNYSAFIYIEDNREFDNTKFVGDFGGLFYEVKKIQDHWYYVVSK
ncbi:hypothetical protein COT83_01440 [Candidatus Peregrinibacteria bacterium CG10_big_fil_rev_8_21_14_0_10_44_7]|nr:MAG: hypothetical protein COT83_01440 [Candidatus Peregrinibacteria bacterium CG10_big_fil_rev_8_21_14_0_10_44_7]PIX80454.1 MAG: hypothetical protein COZ35_00695 [Candidatus Peregrinibacteria bacterium CG_4_10_14_3_um_filter_44_21]PJB89363.1 MAG: hypothetical protein CO082_01280 [Candidatus Peregrinibacteria bacterium CG_4_9_14_0_8_um_filter_44_15]